ncbi:GntR family transcriptional regulator [Curtobacterium citreum]|uniref:GntR family transcriptional regulator n=1 Tax=Curtobacterium citreum TaxID=2036 RepID=A0A850DTP2_9MICO|nr:GntR family transcriptional regulator [Curtobacterium citreum]MDK8172378.1 GntR family transcriptional regulator [Curtobacterium citreum]NUU28331.1 GntR family transcriptional regulator [Curtobacterium albidum]WIJ44693.1 GntR family transcriptional regulator [Curtobacterium citreum]
MVDEVDRDSAVPIYQQLEDIFTAKIASGEWAPSQRIPSENELNRHYGTSRMTVRGVLTKLTTDGVLHRVPGKGTFVAPEKISAVSPAYRGIREQLEVLGYDITTTLVSIDRAPAPARVRDRLGLGRTDDVFAIVRLRSVDGKPLSVHRSFVPAALAPTLDALDVVEEQLCVVLEDAFGLAMHDVAEGLEAVAVAEADAGLLGLRRGDPALQLTDVIADRAGTTFEYSTIVFRGDRMRLQFDYTRP